MIWLAAPVAVLVIWGIVVEVRRYRSFNQRQFMDSEADKKTPAQAEAGTGVEYGGHHLP